MTRPGKLTYPQTRTVDQIDDYFGTSVADPYRWLEDDHSDETAAWVAAQNELTFGYLDNISYRASLKARLQELYNYPRYSAPYRRGDRVFFFKNDGLQDQSVVYVQQGLDGEPEILLDPNTFSEDKTLVLTAFSPSRNGKYAVYGLSEGSSDWQTYRILNIDTRETLPEVIEWVKVSSPAWCGDGFYYGRYDAPEAGTELSSRNEFHKVFYHRLGTPQSEDQLIYEDPEHPLRFHMARTTEDEQYVILYISDRGQAKLGNAIYVKNLATGDTEFTPIVDSITDETYGVVDNVGDSLLISTNKDAPNGRLILVDPQKPTEEHWQTILPERPEPLRDVDTAGGKIFASYLQDVSTRVYVHSLTGELENEILLPELGTAGGFGGQKDDDFVFYTFTSFTTPGTIYRYDITTQHSTVFRAPELTFDPSQFETQQVFYPSPDGTRIPLFLISRKGIERNGKIPTYLYAYGGFNVEILPSFSANRIALLEQGVMVAIANIRGGGEYGRTWHEAAIREKRPIAFQDFIAAAEYLIAENYTNPDKLAIEGRSNGGLLMGAVMNQRPDLFKVVLPGVGVMDMLRFHKFTIGWNWIAEYGSSDNEADFPYLYSYSPLHNIRSDVPYPATLIVTADHDDRVVPAHSFKYAATLQAQQSGYAPVLIRIGTKSGHGASNLTKALEETSDIYAFIFHHLGVEPTFA
ncbi:MULTISPECIES: prolyl oligopeptidase family serine peptidase [unclassified Leptolyngbya]|uniref:prolyl oligopeptidase family serine peptidase n=1 Tax=unclassified Leptolyngbya TaxID=2650499 RepID=UPI0016822345|nr:MULTISPECIES: prolyl oligopeptidase family serine peptidase [unclassified Leptolyngbya]MBD1910780.1 S9 family peptidase [Leptolyngbya sp. FACHB-8]MBD2158856.1 S9 family peptidase [Leptolyngbya sp. FACHB-16]